MLTIHTCNWQKYRKNAIRRGDVWVCTIGMFKSRRHDVCMFNGEIPSDEEFERDPRSHIKLWISITSKRTIPNFSEALAESAQSYPPKFLKCVTAFVPRFLLILGPIRRVMISNIDY